MNKERRTVFDEPSATKVKKSRYGLVLAVILAVSLILTAGFIAFQNPAPRTHDGPRMFHTTIPLGVKFSLSGDPGEALRWGDLVVQLSDGVNVSSWSNVTTQDLTSSDGNVTWHYGSAKSLGLLTVWLNITDSTGDGLLNGGDCLTFTTGRAVQFSSNVYYSMSVIYKPTAGAAFSIYFFP